ncbi:hypothetical protein EDD15DRAFT_2197080 [Pisolithus albus]|nr:hypothetical protein EDD15DRAFT_2197080 [Pisolithus albus]
MEFDRRCGAAEESKVISACSIRWWWVVTDGWEQRQTLGVCGHERKREMMKIRTIVWFLLNRRSLEPKRATNGKRDSKRAFRLSGTSGLVVAIVRIDKSRRARWLHASFTCPTNSGRAKTVKSNRNHVDTEETTTEISIKIKPKLKDIPSSTSIDTASVVKDLHQIASLAKSFSDQRLKWGNDTHLADLLDQQGVNLWNASGLFRQDSDSRVIVAALRLAGFRLMEAGLESEPSIQGSEQNRFSTLSIFHFVMGVELGNGEAAASVLTCAAKFEEALRNHSDPDRAHEHSKARVTTLYFSSRMEAVRLLSFYWVIGLIFIGVLALAPQAWREKNEGLAMFMADKITDNDKQLALLSTRDRELLATKLLDIGKSILRSCHQGGKLVAEDNRAPDALRWMQKAFQVIEPLECTSKSELAELKRAVLRSLARGYFLASSHDPENLTRAEVALEEIISTIDPSVDHTSSEYQQLRWMKLAVVKRRKAGDTELLHALESIIDTMTFSDSDLSELVEFSPHSLGASLPFPSLRCGDFHDQALPLARFGHLRKWGRSWEGDEGLGGIVPRQLIWQYGDRHYHGSRWLEAADWFICGTHAVFSGLGPSCTSKCLRKAALCYIQQKEYARAANAVKRCPVNGATTRYVVFLIAVHQGLEDEATRAVREMVEAADFDRRMLLLACRLAHDCDMKHLLLSVLMALSDTLNFRNDVENLAEAMILIRPPLVKTLLAYFKNELRPRSSAKTLVETVACENVALVIRDLSWLWRTAYNCAIDGCSNWDNHGEEVSSAFDIARQLLELYIAKTLTEVEPSTYVYIANASFAATSGRVRERLSGADTVEPEILRGLSAEIKSCTGRIAGLLDKVPPADRSHLQSFLRFLRVFHVESASHLGEWQTVLETIEEATRDEHQSLVTYEAIGDVLWENKNCPINGMMQRFHASEILYAALEAILHTCLAHGQLSLDKFSRWLRSICSILLAKGSGADRSKAIQYFDQANAVLEEHGDLAENGNPIYPTDERLWLLSTAYNTGVECLHASLVDEARRWFECATVLCRFVPNGKARAEKISETYTDLLARYTRG